MMKKRAKSRYFTQRGVALIAVTIATVIVTVFVTEFSTNTIIDMSAARNAENDLKAHFLTRSAMNLSELFIRMQGAIDKDPNNCEMLMQFLGMPDCQITGYAEFIIGFFGGSKEEVTDLGEAIGGLDEEVIKSLGVPDGTFSLSITTEDNKVNVNCAYDEARQFAASPGDSPLYSQLVALFGDNTYSPIFESEDADGWRRDRETQIAAIFDYIDDGSRRFGANDSERYDYEVLKDSYKSKDNKLDTVGEMKLIRGVDDRFWAVFGNSFTVYGGCKVNIKGLTDPRLIASIIWQSAKEENNPVVTNPQKLWLLAKTVAEAQAGGFPFAKLDDFRQFVQDPQAALEALRAFQAATMAQTTQVEPPVPVEGVELDPQRLEKLVTDGALRTYRVEATAMVGPLSKRLVGIWDSVVTPQDDRRLEGVTVNRNQFNGAWVYWRED